MKNISVELGIAILLFLVGLLLAIFPPNTAVSSISIYQMGGLLISGVAFMWAIFDYKINQCSERRDCCINRFPLEYISNNEHMWTTVSTLIDSALSGSELYGVVSIKNIGEFNKKVNTFAKKINKVNTYIKFKRIICFDSQNSSSKVTKDWFLSMIDVDFDSGHNGKPEYQDLRIAINSGKIEYMYFPKELLADFLILKNSNDTSEMAYSVVTDSHNDYCYSNGFFCIHEHLIDDFVKQFNFLWDEAKTFFGAESSKPVSEQHEFYKYWDTSTNRIKAKI